MKQAIINVAISLGFAEVRFVKPKILEEQKANLLNWLAVKYHSEMNYLARNVDIRTNPALLLNNLQTIVVLACKYPANVVFNQKYKIAKYAAVPDYHTTIKDKLKKLQLAISKIAVQNGLSMHKSRIFVDSGIIMEKQWAALAGLGWQGKNGLIINEKLGSFFNIGIMLLDIDIESDMPVSSKCGECDLCLKACPTGAIVQPKVIDCRNCISYYTIELSNGSIINEDKINSKIEDIIKTTGIVFGCDICQNICPYNKKRFEEPVFQYDFDIDILNYSKDDFKNKFSNSAILRTGYDKFIVNIKKVGEITTPKSN